MIEVRNLIVKYADYCSASDIEESMNKIQSVQNDLDDAARISKVYCSNNIAQDISHCLQNLFAGTQYPVPSELMQDVKNACEASYRYIQSEQYKQMEALLKREINRELEKQEQER